MEQLRKRYQIPLDRLILKKPGNGVIPEEISPAKSTDRHPPLHPRPFPIVRVMTVNLTKQIKVLFHRGETIMQIIMVLFLGPSRGHSAAVPVDIVQNNSKPIPVPIIIPPSPDPALGEEP